MGEVRADTISNKAGTGPATLTGQFAAKIFARINTATTTSLDESGNVSSVTDNGTGDTDVNLTNNMNTANYCTVTGIDKDENINSLNPRCMEVQNTVSAVYTQAMTTAGAAEDWSGVMVASFGDLA